MAAGNGSSCEDLAAETDEEDADRGREEGDDVSQSKSGQFQAGQTGRDMADYSNSHIGQPGHRRYHDGQHHHDERTRELREQPTQQKEGGQAGQPHCQGGPAEVGDLPSDLDDLAGWGLSAHAQAEQFAELTDDQDRRDTVQVPDEYGS